jgi:two-component system LytT family response regulator
MSSLRLVIVEDEPLIRTGIRRDVSSISAVEVVAECDCVADAVEAILSIRPDVVLLDVQLPDGTGFDVVRTVGPQRMPQVIFVTAYDQYAVRAFEVNAVDYLLKPFDGSRLVESLDRARSRLTQPATLIRQLEGLLETHETPWPQRLVVRNGEHFDFVPVDSIDWIESANNYSVLHSRGKSLVFSENLTALEHHLDPSMFLRVHRCHMVNLARVVGVNAIAGGTYELELRGGTTVRTGRQYADAIRKLLKAGR